MNTQQKNITFTFTDNLNRIRPIIINKTKY